MMAYKLFTWDFRTPEDENEAAILAERCATKGAARTTWSTGNSRKIKRGDIAFMLRQGREPRGIIAAGLVRSKEPFSAPDWRGKRGNKLYVDIDWTIFVVEPLILTAELQRRFKKIYWHPRRSGVSLPEQIGKTLAQELKTKRRKIRPTASETVSEDAVRRVERNTYERLPKARQQCITHYGTRCFVCHMAFDEKYGPEMYGLIHVHHLTPISAKRRVRETNPIKDLRPLCPNCHLVIHRREPPYSIAAVKRMLKKQEARFPRS